MDINKIKADVRAAQEKKEMLARTESQRWQDVRGEASNIKQQFRAFFREVHSFQVPMSPKDMDPITARWESISVTLKENTERNKEEKGYKVYFTLTTPDNMVHTIFAEGRPFYHEYQAPTYPPTQQVVPDEEVPLSEVNDENKKFHEEYHYRKIIYKFKYRIEGDERVFESLRGLLEGV